MDSGGRGRLPQIAQHIRQQGARIAQPQGGNSDRGFLCAQFFLQAESLGFRLDAVHCLRAFPAVFGIDVCGCVESPAVQRARCINAATPFLQERAFQAAGTIEEVFRLAEAVGAQLLQGRCGGLHAQAKMFLLLGREVAANMVGDGHAFREGAEDSAVTTGNAPRATEDFFPRRLNLRLDSRPGVVPLLKDGQRRGPQLFPGFSAERFPCLRFSGLHGEPTRSVPPRCSRNGVRMGLGED